VDFSKLTCLPAQFYDVAVDEDVPFYMSMAVQQDNNSVGCAVRTRKQVTTNADCCRKPTAATDSYSRVDPKDPNTIYAAMQNAGIVRFDKRTGRERVHSTAAGEGRSSAPLELGTAPFMISSVLQYAALYRVAESSNRSDDRAIPGLR